MTSDDIGANGNENGNGDTDRDRRTTERRPGFEARFGTDPNEIVVEVRRGRPSYVHVRSGDYVQEGDAFRRERIGTATPLATWEVTSVTPERVVGTDLESGAEREWDREALERGLLVGEYSTNLADFEEISIVQIGRWDDYEGGDGEDAEAGAAYRYDGRPYVTVVAYGDNGRKYARRYRFVDDGETLELWTQDPAVGRFPDEVAARLDERVRAELAADGYEVREPAAK